MKLTNLFKLFLFVLFLTEDLSIIIQFLYDKQENDHHHRPIAEWMLQELKKFRLKLSLNYRARQATAIVKTSQRKWQYDVMRIRYIQEDFTGRQ